MVADLNDIRKMNYEHLHSIWKSAQEGDMDSLSEDDKSLARIMLDHKEFHNQFEVMDLLYDHKYDPDSEVHPYLHVVFHQIIENQLSTQFPIEAFQFYVAIRKKKVSRHDAIHFIAMILLYVLDQDFKGDKPFNLELYRSILKRYKNKKPEKIQASLERELVG